MYLHDFDYVFAIAMIFAFLDAFNIGANDVANSFASSISSRSLKYWQAMILAGICEFLGAVLAGSRVAGTIKDSIISPDLFEEDPAVLMLTMTCALVGSSVWLTIATSIGMPCSTTHSIVGGTIGAGIAAKGAQNITWEWGGVSSIIASWFIAPLIAGCLGTIIFLTSKFTVLEMKTVERSIKNALILTPILVFVTIAILVMLITWKGSDNIGLADLPESTVIASILGTAAVCSAIYCIFFYPFYRRKILHKDWTLKWYEFLWGPIFFFKSTDDIPPMPEGAQLTIDYYEGRRILDDAIAHHDIETGDLKDKLDDSANSANSINSKDNSIKQEVNVVKTNTEPEPKLTTKQLWWRLLKQPKQWPYLLWLVVSHGWTQDVISQQVNGKDMLSGDLKAMYSKSKFYDNRVEFLYSLLQAVTAGTMSFAHGSNDVANATGPLAAVYAVWTTNKTASENSVPVWVLCYGGAALVIGVWTFGYNIIRNLGNKLILQSPSRGFAIELAAAITVVMATRLGIPVSTTQTTVGAIVFVGLCNKDLKSVNWRMVIWCYAGWILTLPIAGIIAGVINGIILNAPHYGGNYTLS